MADDFIIKEEPTTQSIGIYRKGTGLDEHGRQVDERICSVYSIEYLDFFMNALKMDFDKEQPTKELFQGDNSGIIEVGIGDQFLPFGQQIIQPTVTDPDENI